MALTTYSINAYNINAGGLGLRFYDGSSVKAYLKINFG